MSTFTQSSFPSRPAMQVGKPTISKTSRFGFNSAQSLSAMLLAAMVSALVVVADQLIDNWAEGHLMLAWIALWAVGFAAVGVFAGAARKLAFTLVQSLDSWSARAALKRADNRLWASAQADPRIMADLTSAMSRHHSK